MACRANNGSHAHSPVGRGLRDMHRVQVHNSRVLCVMGCIGCCLALLKHALKAAWCATVLDDYGYGACTLHRHGMVFWGMGCM